MSITYRIFFKKAISDITYYLSKIDRTRAKKNNNFRILLYHSIGSRKQEDILGIRVSKENFYNQMKFLHDNNYNVVRLEELIKLIQSNRRITEKTIAITFDDGYKDNLTEAAPVLKEFYFPGLIFVCMDYIESNKKESDDYWTKWGFLTKEDLRYLSNCDMDIGLHSLTHIRLTELNYEQISNEIIKSKTGLESCIDKKVNLFSYPHGAFNNIIVDTLKANGFIAACCSIGGSNSYGIGPFGLRRTEITRDDTIHEFTKKLHGCYDIINWLKNI